MDDKIKKTSKFLSLLLRHKPESIGLSLNNAGWASVEELVSLSQNNRTSFTEAMLKEIVESDEKQRYSFSDDGKLIRANQGHSIQVELGLLPSTPPTKLYHGTASRFEQSIRESGLLRGNRQHVHLSDDTDTALTVGRRHGKPLIFSIDAEAMHEQGYLFYRSENGVWLTDHVPFAFLKIFNL